MEVNFTKFTFDRDLKTGPSTYRLIFGIYESFKNEKEKHILLDLSQISWIDANLCALIDAIIYVLKRDCNHYFYLNQNDIKNRFDVFERNGFLKDFSDDYVVIDDRGTTVQMTRFSDESVEEFLDYIGENMFENSAFQNMPEIKTIMVDHFLEVFANIQTHSKTTNPIFACGQFFPSIKTLKFTLLDLGVGFLEPISNYTKGKIDTPEDALLWALAGNSTKIDCPGGLGLSGLKAYCDKNAHVFQIISNGKCWGNNLGQIKFWDITNFPGALVNLEFKCK